MIEMFHYLFFPFFFFQAEIQIRWEASLNVSSCSVKIKAMFINSEKGRLSEKFQAKFTHVDILGHRSFFKNLESYSKLPQVVIYSE